MISTYPLHGEAMKALEMFESMIMEGAKPNERLVQMGVVVEERLSKPVTHFMLRTQMPFFNNSTWHKRLIMGHKHSCKLFLGSWMTNIYESCYGYKYENKFCIC
ncbi:hypothetical protein Fmac_005392 [Flemingia macrophylla]|uniref:Pentatricopeptide repeat-containing protein n=1 Tax=Flemingia macrophylla TaxID=520843 RepID=A0ABD1N7M8_9FABA